MTSPGSWRTPKSRSVGLFTDLRLFHEALEIAAEQGVLNRRILEEELPQRLQGLLFVERQSERAAKDLIRELRSFKWIMSADGSKRPAESANYHLLPDGKKALELGRTDKRAFLRNLTTNMQELYTIPAWFVDRLWAINPSRQGEVVVPTPLRDWNPISRLWEDKAWTSELATETERTLFLIKDICSGAFPMNVNHWLTSVEKAWDRLSNLEQRKVAKLSKSEKGKEKGKVRTYSPRGRLTLAMREAAVNFLFSSHPPNSKKSDFAGPIYPLAPRTYMGWCPRLEALELIFYTDVHPTVPGRLLFPTSVFRTSAPEDSFDRVGYINNPAGKFLWLHRPKWEVIRKDFFQVLNQEHLRVSARVGSLYVSLLDVRDEVCRQLRLSASCFDEYMEKAIRESVLPGSHWSISVETDIREDQRSGPRSLRRQAWIDGIPHSLIAMTENRESSQDEIQGDNL